MSCNYYQGMCISPTYVRTLSLLTLGVRLILKRRDGFQGTVREGRHDITAAPAEGIFEGTANRTVGAGELIHDMHINMLRYSHHPQGPPAPPH